MWMFHALWTFERLFPENAPEVFLRCFGIFPSNSGPLLDLVELILDQTLYNFLAPGLNGLAPEVNGLIIQAWA